VTAPADGQGAMLHGKPRTEALTPQNDFRIITVWKCWLCSEVGSIYRKGASDA
jgi:hypothetical protein